ncbi:MAG: radical SAM protein [Bacteroidales bacterium]|nr:radical SAM protein [Bacteroidales bacterium]
MYINIRIYLKQLLYQKPIAWFMIEILQGISFLKDYFTFYKLPGNDNKASIKEINIEFANFCNLRCNACSLDHHKVKSFLSIETLDKFLYELISDQRFRNVEIINLHNGGEVLLHPKINELLQVIKRHKTHAIKQLIPFPKIYLLTNGMKLNDQMAHILIQSEVIDVIGFSIDGGTPELFHSMRNRSIWPVLYNNIKQFYHLNQIQKHKIEIYAISCIPEEKPLNIKWMHPEFQHILNLLDRYELRRLHNWAGDIEQIESRTKKHKIGCTLLMRQMVLLPGGNITLCCNDLNSKEITGNIHTEDLYSIYKSNTRVQYLSQHLKGKKENLKLCQHCETF